MVSLPAHMIYTSRERSLETGIAFDLAVFRKANDYCANKTLEALGKYSLTFTDKPVWLISTLPDGQMVVETVTKIDDNIGEKIGPTYMIAKHNDTKYFSIRDHEYSPIGTIEIVVEDGNSFYTGEHIGYTCCIITGAIENKKQGSVFTITEPKHLIVTGRTKLVLAKKV